MGIYYEDITEALPGNTLLQTMGINSYIAAPVSVHSDLPVTILVALYKTPRSLKPIIYPFETFSAYLNSLAQRFFVSSNLNSQFDLLKELSAITKAGAWEYTLATSTLYWSDEVFDIHAFPRNTSITPGLSIKHYQESDRDRINQLFNNAIVTGKSYQTECEFVDARGNHKWIRTSGKVRKNQHDETISVYGAFEDITQELALLNKEKYEREYLKSVLNSMNDAVITMTQTGKILDVNNAANRVFGFEKTEMQGLSVSALMPEPYASKHSHYLKQYLRSAGAKEMRQGRQLPALKKNGQQFQMELMLSEIWQNEKRIFIGIIRDVSERIRAKESVYKAAFTDKITGLKNRSWFERELGDVIRLAEIQEQEIYCALVDIDKLSYYNMRFGYRAGDKVIKAVATALEQILPENAWLYKNTVDSFFIMSVVAADKGSTAMSDMLAFESKIMKPDNFNVVLGGKTETPTVSIGSIFSKASLISYQSLVDVLEFARDNAKKQSPSGYYCMGASQQTDYERDKRVRVLLESVTHCNELEIVLQPQYATEDCFNSSEALLRWKSKELGFVSPAQFIPIAEESDAIFAIGEWVIRRVCQLLAQLSQECITTQVAINISGRQIVQKDFKEKLLAITNEYQVDPRSLILELTETALVSDIQLVKEVMLSLNKVGFRFSIDDFGTGYSSLSYLKGMPIAELKIDKCFVDEIEHEDSSATIVDVIINMSKALKVKTIAEGVEHWAQYQYLKQRGCDLSQGYLFSKPLSVDDWKKKVLEQQ